MAHIHHVQILVQNGSKYVQKFTRNVNFQLFAERKSPNLRQWVVRSGSIVIVLTERNNAEPEQTKNLFESSQSTTGTDGKPRVESPSDGTTSTIHSLSLPDQCFLDATPISSSSTSANADHGSCPPKQDTVFNVAFEVNNVPGVLINAEKNGAKVLCRPTVVKDSINGGHVTIAAIQSCIGNVVHTLVDCSNYKGVFLPGFIATDTLNCELEISEKSNAVKPSQHKQLCLMKHIDHVTFACLMGSSAPVLEWYEKCFGMKRFLLMREENEDEGFIVQGKNVGLRLKAMEYWHCAETGLSLPTCQEDHSHPRPPKAKFVLAEALPGQGPSQVETFLEQHNGAGIQHIGFHTDNILETVRSLRDSGLSMIDPPPAYYSQVGKLAEISRIRRDVELLKTLGILLDEERCQNEDKDETSMETANEDQSGKDAKMQYKYLMQVFTKPVFERDTFFLEIIQRHGATGFGAGNISALWRAVQAYMSYDEQQVR